MAKTKAKVLTAEPAGTTEDVKHEDVTNLPSVVDKYVEQAMHGLEVPTKQLEELKAQAAKLSIKDVSDKKGYEEMKAFRRGVSKVGKYLEKEREARSGVYFQTSRAINARFKILQESVKEIEDPLSAELEKYEKEQADIERRKQEARATLQALRIKEMIGKGMNYDGVFYTLTDVSIRQTDIADMTEQQYSDFMGHVSNRAKAIEDEKARKEQAEADERKRLADEQEKLANERKEIEDEREISRGEQLGALGLIWNPCGVWDLEINGNREPIRLHDVSRIRTATAAEWSDIMAVVRKNVSDVKAAAELKETKRKADEQREQADKDKKAADMSVFKARAMIIEDMGFIRTRTTDYCADFHLGSKYPDKIEGVGILLTFEPVSDEIFNTTIQNLRKKVEELKEKEKEQDMERKGDAEKVKEWYSRVNVIPQLSDEKLQGVANRIHKEFTAAIRQFASNYNLTTDEN
jgi:hypothetical protein